MHGGGGLIRQAIQDSLQLQTDRFERRVVRLTRDPNGSAVEKQASREGIRDHETIPAREEFFFEQANAKGIIGSPVAFANCTTPSFAI